MLVGTGVSVGSAGVAVGVKVGVELGVGDDVGVEILFVTGVGEGVGVRSGSRGKSRSTRLIMGNCVIAGQPSQPSPGRMAYTLLVRDLTWFSIQNSMCEPIRSSSSSGAITK